MKHEELLEGFNAFLKRQEAQEEENKALRAGLQELAGKLESAIEFIKRLQGQIRHPHTIFDSRVDEWEMSVRTYNSMKNLYLETTGDVVKKTEGEFLQVKNFGRKSLKELKDILGAQGLRLGMTDEQILNWTPPQDSK